MEMKVNKGKNIKYIPIVTYNINSRKCMFTLNTFYAFVLTMEKSRILTSFGPLCDLENKANVTKLTTSRHSPSVSYMKNQYVPLHGSNI